MKAAGVVMIVFFFALVLAPGHHILNVTPAYAQDNWKTEFDELCSLTQDVMAFTPVELKGYIDRCDRLKPLIAKLGESESKVFLKRLELCRNLFAYALEVKENRK